MLTFNFRPVRISLTFGFFFVIGITSLSGNDFGPCSLAFCLLHELGHLAAMLIFNARVTEITFYGAGIKISADGIGQLPVTARAIIYLGGPAVNLLLAACIPGDLGTANLFLGIFNLLPISYFDGGRLADMVFEGKRGVREALSVLSYALIAAAALAAALLTEGGIKPSSLLTFLFITMSYLFDS